MGAKRTKAGTRAASYMSHIMLYGRFTDSNILYEYAIIMRDYNTTQWSTASGYEPLLDS